MGHTPAPYRPRAVYGFALYVGSNMALALYLLWAFVPGNILHDYLGLTYWPLKYWAIAIPIWALTALATFALIVYPAINLSMTPDIDDIRTITDNFAQFNNRVSFEDAEQFSPLFYSLAWHRRAATNNDCHLETVKNFPSNTLLHLTANGLKQRDAHQILYKALAYGKVNIFALQGDTEIENGDYPHAVDLVSDIRKSFSGAFTICVAGYPETHPRSTSKYHDLLYLKEKVDAGADFVITQFCFEPSTYINFVKDCREFGITVPIIPGILVVQSYKSLLKLKSVSGVNVPSELLKRFRLIKDDNEAIKTMGIKVASSIARVILNGGGARGFHLFSSNSISSAISVWNNVRSDGQRIGEN